MTTPLCKLAEKYIVDKCPKYNHYYTPKYYEILKDKEYKKVLEAEYGSININLEDGSYTTIEKEVEELEDVKEDKKD